ncbi:MAG: hypothetical protein Q9182_003232 [Xanthomendoza sp. 2 TL-2023]
MRFAGTDLDLDLELRLDPVIQELVRTQVCFPNLKLLVDKILVVTLPEANELSGNEAFKLTLTDGEKTIQALLKRRIYKTLYNEDIREGSFVILKVYHLARGKKINGKGTITYLVIEDFFAIGEDDRYDESPVVSGEPNPATVELDLSETRDHGQPSVEGTVDAYNGEINGERIANSKVQELPSIETSIEYEIENAASDRVKDNARPTPPSSQQQREAMKRKWDTALEEIDANDTYRVSKYRRLEETRAKEAQAAADASAKALLVRLESLPTTPLVAITGPNKRRNTRHDILALIISVSPDIIKRNGMPPKRDLRIMDISTTKKVLLSVFARAEDFQPEPGTVALLKHLTTHDYDGGSLNAYAKDCSSPDWFVVDPPGFENGEVAQLKDCWARLQYSEKVGLGSNDPLSQIYEPLDIPEEEDIADHLHPVSGKKHLTCFYWATNGTCRKADDECAYAHYNTGIVAHDPMQNQSTTTGNQSNAKPLTGLPPSKSLTCFFWARNRKCNRSDTECSYAHYDTGTIAKAPPGVIVFEPSPVEEAIPPAKVLTCYFWNRDGRCSRSDADCRYAHYATGMVAYPPPNVVASTPANNDSPAGSAPGTSAAANPPAASASGSGGKFLTCFFWARNRHCTRSDAECRYAHYDTGTVANNPSQPFVSELPQKTAVVPKASSTATSAAQPPTVMPETLAIPMPAPALPTPMAIPSAPPPPQPTTITTPIPTSTTANPIHPSAAAPAPPATSTGPSFPSVKHLTCYFWANFGRCKRSDEACRYAHFHTGRMAVNPMELRRVRR